MWSAPQRVEAGNVVQVDHVLVVDLEIGGRKTARLGRLVQKGLRRLSRVASPKGIKTAQTDVDVVERRLKVAQQDHEVRYGKPKR
jgi:hypothetical protein